MTPVGGVLPALEFPTPGWTPQIVAAPQESTWDFLANHLSPPALTYVRALAGEIEDRFVRAVAMAESTDALRQRFESSVPEYARLLWTLVLVVFPAIRSDCERWCTLVEDGFDRVQNIITEHGRESLGEQASLNLHMAVATARRLSRFLDPNDPAWEKLPVEQRSKANTLCWQSIGLSLALSAVGMILSGQVRPVSPSVPSALSDWCLGFTDRMAKILRALGRLGRVGPGLSPQAASGLGEDEGEDRELANAGLEEYARLLAAEDGAA